MNKNKIPIKHNEKQIGSVEDLKITNKGLKVIGKLKINLDKLKEFDKDETTKN